MNKVKTIKVKNEDGSVSEESYAIAADALNIDMVNGKNVQETIGTIDVDKDGDIAAQLNKKINKSDIIDNLDSTDANKVLSAKQGKVLNEAVAAANSNIKKKIYYFNTVANMKAANLQAGDTCQTLGYYLVNDGGAGLYKIVDDSQLVDDGGSIHNLSNGLKAKLIIEDFIKPEQLGAKGDNIQDDLQYFNKAIELNNNILLTSNKTYLLTDTLVINKPIYLNGNNSKIHYDGDNIAISITSSGNLHTSDRGIIENLIINAENSDKVINWNYSIKSLLRNIKIYNFSHYGIYVQNAGYETRFENIYFACKKLPNTVAIYGKLSDMDIGALYGVNVKNFMQITDCASKIELIHAWCANIPLFDEPVMTDEQYNEWYSNTIMINFKQGANAYPLVIDYLYADTYHDVLYYQTYHRYITINNLSFIKSTNLIKYDSDYKNYIIYTSINNIYIDKTKLQSIDFYPSISKINGFKASKTRSITIGSNNIDVPVDNVIPYTIKQTGALNLNIKNIVGLPAIYSIQDYGANCKVMFPFINSNGIDVTYSNGEDVPSSQYNVRFYLKAKPLQRGESFKYSILDNIIE